MLQSTTNYELLATDNWHLATDHWHLPTDNWHLPTDNWHLATDNWYLATDNWYLATFFVSLHLSRILYKLVLFYAKQTQFQNRQNEHNLSNNSELYQ
jgi:hypothetical protein